MEEMKSEELKDKAVKLYQYLKNLIGQRLSVVLDLGNYVDVVWLHQIPHHELCHCATWNYSKDEPDPVWVEIKRPKLPKVPQVPDECSKWVDLSTLENYDSEPVIRDRIIREDSPREQSLFPKEQEQQLEYLKLSDHPEVNLIWEKYLGERWKPWADDYKQKKEVQDIYSRLFSMYQQQRALGESYEVVMGLGLLSYKTEKGAKIYRHILSAQTELSFEANKGTIVIRANSEGTKLQFEDEMLDPTERPDVRLQLQLEEQLKEISNEIWDTSLIHPVLRSWINGFNPKSVYEESLIPPPSDDIKSSPEASFAPAIVLRKRTNRGIMKFIERIIEQLQNTGHVPFSIRGLLYIEDSSQKKRDQLKEDEPRSHPTTFNAPKEIYFPLSVNEEQERVIKELNTKNGILVQGPPGTGKSHTIANLICHLLAEGKRVLITSQTARSLKVLKEKIPEQIQPLCVSVLGNRQEDLDNLRNAVHDITRKKYSWDTSRNAQFISDLESKLYDLKKKCQDINASLRELREEETYKHTIINGKFNGTAQSISKQLSETENRYGWIPDEISSSDEAPLSQSEFTRLLDLYRELNKGFCEELLLKKIDSSSIFTPEEFVEIIDKEQKYEAKERDIESNIKIQILYNRLKKISIDKRRKLLATLTLLRKAISEASRRPLPWLNKAVYSMLGDQDQPLKELAAITKKYLENLKEKALLTDDYSVSIPKDMDMLKIKADAEDLLQHLGNGKKLGWWVFRPKLYKRIKYLLKNVLVNGRLCDNAECLKKLVDYIYVENNLGKLKEAWKEKMQIPPTTRFNQVAIISEQLEALEVILEIESPLIDAKRAVKDIEEINEPSWHEEDEIDSLINGLESTFVIDEMNKIKSRLEEVEMSLKPITTRHNAHPVNTDLLRALEAKDWNKWGEAYEYLVKLEKGEKLREEMAVLMRKLKEKAPLLVDELCKDPNNEAWEQRCIDFEESWNWLRADAWIREFEEKHDEYQLQRDYSNLQDKISNIIAELASAKAWDNCFNSLTEEERQHLMAWSKAIQRIGKGTGKRAEKHRLDAQDHMEKCREAIPGWVMPLYRVAESIPPHAEIFDVVIIDEASQCGPEALFLLYIAKKCIVVGDDQQISPEGVGIERKNIDLLIDRFLRDIPHADSYGLETSLFGHAEIRYGGRIVLKEHFRCVPEIIQFSNDLCYVPLGISLIPLREYPPQRLTPVCTQYIRDGYRDGEGQYTINRPEAEAIAKQIISCCKDPSYKGKTMGVISLQGDNQARFIERLLVEELGPEEIEQRNLVCGNPYDFQGDERDIIFLSLVAARNRRIGPLVRDTDKRRFNVAFSRARDQIWLFHSVTLNDLSPNCYRYKLLAYCQNPRRLQQDINEDVFESQFEKDVYKELTNRNYKVIPQYRVANYRIDMVVEGMKNRLAVECDGDEWHGPDKYEQDMRRQRILERSGWIFWRIRGSSFYKDREQALEGLWQRLEELNIYSTSYTPPVEETETAISESMSITEPISKEEEIIKVAGLPEKKEVEFIVKPSDEKDRLETILEYATRLSEERDKKLNKDLIKGAIINILKQGSQGDDLLADNVLRFLQVRNRGRERARLKRRVRRVLSDIKRDGLITEYYTNKRKRIKLNNGTVDLFSK